MCPGCKEYHSINTKPGNGPVWGFNDNVDSPTFTPSVLTWWDEPADDEKSEKLYDELGKLNAFSDEEARKVLIEQIKAIPKVAKRCHSFVANGNIQFLGDCTHELAGQTVRLSTLPPDQ